MAVALRVAEQPNNDTYFCSVRMYDTTIFTWSGARLFTMPGWFGFSLTDLKGIAYSPLIRSVGTLPERGGFDEWYVFGTPVDLGEKGRGNVFEAPLSAGQVEVFVNFAKGFDLHQPDR
jgi:hypothetical protein